MYKVAIVDDERNILDVLNEFLEFQYDVTIFQNPIHAFESVLENDYDIVLCDIMMPQMTGLEFLKKLRDKQDQTKVVMMTAFDSMDKALEAHKYGAKHYIKKPFKNLTEIESKIAELIEN